jgi:small subunit ribosomal protein S20
MAHHKSAIKKIRQDVVRNNRNKAYRTRVRNAVKKTRTAIADGNLDEAKTAYQKMVPLLDRMADRNILHPNSSARLKSRLNRQIKSLVANS